MLNPIDTRQAQSLVEYRQRQLCADYVSPQKIVWDRTKAEPRLQRVRVAVGKRMMRAGARIAGIYGSDLPRPCPGI